MAEEVPYELRRLSVAKGGYGGQKITYPEGDRNFTSTPCSGAKSSSEKESTKSRLHTAVSAKFIARPSRPRLSFGGISTVSPRKTNLRLPETAFRSGSAASVFGDIYPISRLTVPDTCDLTTDRISNNVPAMQGLTLTCHNITLAKDESSKCPGKSCLPVVRHHSDEFLLRDISAYFCPGVNVVMGPSGCGKTSLLSVLSSRRCDFVGSVMINGKTVPKNLSQFCGFSAQTDILNPGLTVREHLWFSLCLRRRDGLGQADRIAIIDDVLASLRLRDCSERKVGFAETTLVSGGERKRTAIGMELVAGPKIIFLDEPTTSLDSNMSKTLMKILRDLGDKGRTIILTIHQPSNSLFKLCDNLTLLSHSRLVYHGHTTQALDYFTSLGFVHGPHYSRPDFFLDILFGKVPSNHRRKLTKSTTHPKRMNSIGNTGFFPTYWTTVAGQKLAQYQDGVAQRNIPTIKITKESPSGFVDDIKVVDESLASPGHAKASFVSSRSCGYSSILDGTTKDGSKEHFEIALWLAEKFKMSLMGRAMDEELIQLEIATDGDPLSHLLFEDGARPASIVMESYLLCKRSLNSSRRLCFALAFMNIAIGLLFGVVYYHPSSTRPLVQNRLGMLFYLSIHGIIVPSMINAKNFVTHEKLLLKHERQAGFYRTSSYCISRLLILFLARLFSSVLLSSIVYWMTGLRPDAVAFVNFISTGFMAGLASDSLCLLCVIGHQSFAVGKSFVMMYTAVTSIFAGFLLNLDSAFPWLSWIKYVSISRYCYVGWVVGEFAPNCIEQSDENRNCGRLENSVLIDVVGNDKFLVQQPWAAKCALAFIALINIVFCYIRMRFDQPRHTH